MIVAVIGLYPPGGGKISAVVRCPKEVAASAYERFGKVGPITEEKYRSLIAKVCVWDESRPAAIARALRALRELEVEGVPTTREAALEIIASDDFRDGEYSTSWLEQAELEAVAL